MAHEPEEQTPAQIELDLDAIMELAYRMADESYKALMDCHARTAVKVYAVKCFEQRWKQIRF